MYAFQFDHAPLVLVSDLNVMATVSETGRSGEFERLLAVLNDQLLTKYGTTVTTANRLKQVPIG